MKIIKFLTLSFFAVIVFMLPAGAASNGRTAVPFIEMPSGARYIAMGGAGTAIADDSNAMYWNPGLLGVNEMNCIDLMHSMYIEETFYDYASVMYKVGDNHGIGLLVQYFSYGNIETFDNNGNSTGDINPYDIAAALGYGIDIKGFGIGVSAKVIQSKIVNTATAFAVDMGISFPPLLNDSLYFGLAAANFGDGITYDKEKEELPETVRFGLGYYITDELLLAADVGYVKYRDIYGAAGLEYSLMLGYETALYFRGGYNTISDSDGITGLTAGAGFEYKSFIIDYAFVPLGELDNTHRVSLTFYWY